MLRERFAADANVEEVEAFLSNEGYDRRQIGEILSLLFSEIPIRTTGAQSVVHNHMTFRVMGPHERGRFAPDAWGHLLTLTGPGRLRRPSSSTSSSVRSCRSMVASRWTTFAP